MQVKINESWKNQLNNEFEKPYFADLIAFVKQEYQQQQIFPPGNCIFKAFDSCDFEAVKVVILGQDPYHGDGQAHGLSFSVQDGVALPPSLVNIYKELASDLGITPPKSGNLTRWAEQGVLLLNATLTVRAHQAGSHQGKGWEKFTDEVIHRLAEEREGVVFILWGGYAQKKGGFIDNQRHMVIKSPHPSPLSSYRGFFGSKPFSQTNKYLIENDKAPIAW